MSELEYRVNVSRYLIKQYERFLSPKLGIIFALFSQLFGSIMALSSKLLLQDKDFPKPLNPMEVILVRMILTAVVTISYSIYDRHPDFPLGPKNLRLFILVRAISGCTGIYCLYYSLQYISISTSTIMGFLSPVITLILLFYLLDEKYTIFEGVGGLFSMAGVLLVIRPSFLFHNTVVSDSGVESLDPHKRTIGLFVAFLGCLLNSVSSILLRHIGLGCDAVVSVQIFTVVSGIFSAVGLAVSDTGFQPITTFRQLYLFIQLGISGFLTQFFWTCGMLREKAGRLVLLTYFGMIYSIFWEFVIWHHVPVLTTWVGFFIIVASSAVVIYLKPNDDQVELELDIELDSSGSSVKSIEI